MKTVNSEVKNWWQKVKAHQSKFWVLLDCKNDCKSNFKDADHMLECLTHWVSLCYQCHHKKWSYQAQENAKILQRNCDTSWNSLISKNNWLTYFKAVVSAYDSRSVSEIDWSWSLLSIKSYRDIAEDDRSMTCCDVQRLVSRSILQPILQSILQLILQSILRFKYWLLNRHQSLCNSCKACNHSSEEYKVNFSSYKRKVYIWSLFKLHDEVNSHVTMQSECNAVARQIDSKYNFCTVTLLVILLLSRIIQVNSYCFCQEL